MKSEQPKIRRLILIMRLLNSREKGIDIIEISKAANISKRTAFRYLALLNDTGIAVEKRATEQGTFYRIQQSGSEINTLIPEIDFSGKQLFPKVTVASYESPVWIFKGKGVDEYAVFDSLPALYDNVEIPDTINVLYKKLQNNSVAIYPGCRVIRAKRYSTRHSYSRKLHL